MSWSRVELRPNCWVNKWDNWLVKPQSESTPPPVIQDLVDQTKAIAKRFQSQVDIEWAYDGRDLYFLQMRDITTLNRHNVYSNSYLQGDAAGHHQAADWQCERSTCRRNNDPSVA